MDALKTRKYLNNFFILILVLIILIITLFPIYWTLSSSLTNTRYLFSPPAKYYPVGGITFANYKTVLATEGYAKNFVNSLIIALLASGIVTVLSFIAAYAFSRINFRFKNVIFYLIIASMLIPQISTVMPMFQLYRGLHLFDKIWGLIILDIGILIPFSVWIFSTFINNVPKELEEAALIDGVNIFGHLTRIMAPILKQALGVIFLINFVNTWNEMLFAVLFIINRSQMPLSAALVKMSAVDLRAIPWDTLSAGSMIMIIPIIILSVAFQRQIVSGWTAGSIK